MDALVAQGRGNTLVSGGGCTEPGGGIVPTTHTAREMAAMLRQQVARCGAGMLAQQPGDVSWLLNEARTLSKGTTYQFILAMPGTLQDCCGAGSAADLLTQQGWSVTSFNAPPPGYAQAMQVLVSQNLPTPTVYMVLATWNGVDGAVLPPNNGQLYFGPIYTEYMFVGPPAPEPQPAPEPPVTPTVWPSVAGFVAGVAIIGGAWWYVRKHATAPMVPAYAENPTGMFAGQGDDDFDLKTEMETGLIIGDARRGGYDVALEGRFLGHFTEWNDALKFAAQTMVDNSYWPNVFYVNERGNTDLLVLKPKIIHGKVIKVTSTIDRSWV